MSAPQAFCETAFDRPIDRVVIIHDHATPVGGAGVLALMAAREYRKLGLPVTFFTGGSGNATGDLEGIDLIALGTARLLDLPKWAAMRQGLYSKMVRNALAAWIVQNDTERTVYHLHNWSQTLSPAVFEALRPVEQRTIVTCHDFFNACPNGSFLDFQKSKLCVSRPLSPACLAKQCDRRGAAHKYWRVLRHLQLGRSAAFGDSRATFTFLHARMRDKFVEAGFAAQDLRINPNPAEAWSKQRIAAEENTRLLFVGRIGRDKGADIAVEAAHAAKMPITLVGSGELAEDLAARFPEVRLAGWCDRSGIAAAAKQARTLIVPSRVTEPFGLVILEAAMSGLPVLVSDRAYLSSDVERDDFGIAFDPDDPRRLVALLSRLMRDDDAVRRMSLNGVSRAAACTHSPESWAGSFVRIFCEKLRPGTFRATSPEPASELLA